MTKFLAVVVALALALQATPPSDTCKQETWVTNGY
jgi:hypothetical protein